jgi:hypothetical protein
MTTRLSTSTQAATPLQRDALPHSSEDVPSHFGQLMGMHIESALAAATLHLVDAYKAVDILSKSPFAESAPYSFELAWQCLCTSLLALDECATNFGRSSGEEMQPLRLQK